MKIDLLMKRIEAIMASLAIRQPRFTGSLALQINFFEGKPKDIEKVIERQREKIT